MQRAPAMTGVVAESSAEAGGADGCTPGARSINSAQLHHMQDTVIEEDDLEDSSGWLHPQATLDFEDRREERRQCGHIKWKPERGVPDVGGLGWRSRNGHLLKNQTFYGTKPNENLWNNPTHAGPRTWKEYHGPRLRSDAPLMARLDRLDADQEEWETKKAFLNTVRVQTLDRVYHQKVENYQKEIASQWAPHRRTRKEIHSSLDGFSAELNSMPMKELKKVLTPHVLKADRDAIRNIAKRVQVEETWRSAWKQVERDRHDDTRTGLQQRTAYNDMLMELSGQPVKKGDPSRRVPKQWSQRTDDLSTPTGPRHSEGTGDISTLADVNGLVHFSHKLALEARFPGSGHQMSTLFEQRAAESTKAGWPPPPPPETPVVGKRGKANSLAMSADSQLRQASVPVPRTRLDSARLRVNAAVMEHHASEQYLNTSAPPPPDQKDQLLHEPLANSTLHMTQDFSPRSLQTTRSLQTGSNKSLHGDVMDLAPPRRGLVYHVVVPAAEPRRLRPNWKPKRQPPTSPRDCEPSANCSAPGERWPPMCWMPVKIKLIKATGLPRADVADHSDPFVAVQVVGKKRSRVCSKVVQDSENPVFNEELNLVGWKKGETLVISIFDHDKSASHQKLAIVEVPFSMFYPKPFSGVLTMKNAWVDNGVRMSPEIKEYNIKTVPRIEVSISAESRLVDSSDEEDALGDAEAYAELAMPNADPSIRSVCDHLHDFEKKTAPVPRLGNFWMHPSAATTTVRTAAVQSAR